MVFNLLSALSHSSHTNTSICVYQQDQSPQYQCLRFLWKLASITRAKPSFWIYKRNFCLPFNNTELCYSRTLFSYLPRQKEIMKITIGPHYRGISDLSLISFGFKVTFSKLYPMAPWNSQKNGQEKESSDMPGLHVHRSFRRATAQMKDKAPLNQLNGSYNYHFYSPANILAVVPVLQWNQLNNCLLQNNETRFIDYIVERTGQKSKNICCLLSSCKKLPLSKECLRKQSHWIPVAVI